MKRSILLAISLIFFYGCGGGGSSSSAKSKIETLSAGEQTTISSGDTLEPSSEDTVIKVRHNTEDDSKVVSVVSGQLVVTKQ